MGNLKGLLGRADSEVGYIEKASNSNLDSKTANKGTKNYTKYSRDVNNAGLAGCQGQAWCATYQFWLELKEFGKEKALKLWHMEKKYVGYNCFATYDAFKAAGKVSTVPKLGALVIFKRSHMARVTWISEDGKTFGTNEGNTSAKKYDRNGGQVAKKSYSVDDDEIKGFCIIDYEEEPKVVTGLEPVEDGYMFNAPDLVKGDKGEEVKFLQRLLIGWGYNVGSAGVDSSFGSKTEKAVKQFQADHNIKVNYPGTVGPKTWTVLIGM